MNPLTALTFSKTSPRKTSLMMTKMPTVTKPTSRARLSGIAARTAIKSRANFIKKYMIQPDGRVYNSEKTSPSQERRILGDMMEKQNNAVIAAIGEMTNALINKLDSRHHQRGH